MLPFFRRPWRAILPQVLQSSSCRDFHSTAATDAARQLRDSAPSAKIVFLTVHSEQQFVDACMAEGALGYVHKSCMKAHLIPAIQAALLGQSYVGPFAPTRYP